MFLLRVLGEGLHALLREKLELLEAHLQLLGELPAVRLPELGDSSRLLSQLCLVAFELPLEEERRLSRLLQMRSLTC